MSGSSQGRRTYFIGRDHRAFTNKDSYACSSVKTTKNINPTGCKENTGSNFNSNTTHYRVIGHSDVIKNMTVKDINRASYLEIFQSNKDSIKKSINYMNYTNQDYDLITNNRLSSAYTSFRDNLMLYESGDRSFDPDSKAKFLNRSPPHRNRNKHHILMNIRNIKNLEDFNRLKTLDINRHKLSSQPTSKDKYVFFKRKGKSTTSRRLNENDYSTLSKSRPKTDNQAAGSKSIRLKKRLSINNNLLKSLERSIRADNPSDAGSLGRTLNRTSLDAVKDDIYAFSTIDHRKRYNNSIEAVKRQPELTFDNRQKNDLFRSLQDKIRVRCKNPVEQKKALNRIELLRGYLNVETQPFAKLSEESNQIYKFVDKVKNKMTQELIKFSKSRENSIEKSAVMKRLKEGLMLKVDPIKAILYARDYIDKSK